MRQSKLSHLFIFEKNVDIKTSKIDKMRLLYSLSPDGTIKCIYERIF